LPYPVPPCKPGVIGFMNGVRSGAVAPGRPVPPAGLRFGLAAGGGDGHRLPKSDPDPDAEEPAAPADPDGIVHPLPRVFPGDAADAEPGAGMMLGATEAGSPA
jgi:hypothetical protein